MASTLIFQLFLQVFDERLEFYQTWPDMLQDNTKYNLGWSYIIAWFGILLTLIASILFASSGIAIKVSRSDHEDECAAAIVNEAYESADYTMHTTMQSMHNGTLNRHASMQSIHGLGMGPHMGPMGSHVMAHPAFLPPGAQQFQHELTYYAHDDPVYRKEIEEFSEAKL